MNEAEFLGYVVLAIITLSSFIAVANKFTQPINDLKVVVQELRDCISSLKETNNEQNRRINRHGEEIDNLKSRVKAIETKIELYHGKGSN